MTTVYIIGLYVSFVIGVILAAIVSDDFWEDFLAMVTCAIFVAFIWPVALIVAIGILILKGIWLFIRAEDFHRNVWEWMKKAWVKI